MTAPRQYETHSFPWVIWATLALILIGAVTGLISILL